MNKRLDEAINRLRELPEERQQAAASLLLDFLEHDAADDLTPEQIAEIERRLQEDDVATDAEVKDFFAHDASQKVTPAAFSATRSGDANRWPKTARRGTADGRPASSAAPQTRESDPSP